MTDIYEKMCTDLKKIVDMYLHQLRFREIVLSINYMSNCHNCDEYFVKQSNIFTNNYKNELGIIKWVFEIPNVCCYGFFN